MIRDALRVLTASWSVAVESRGWYESAYVDLVDPPSTH